MRFSSRFGRICLFFSVLALLLNVSLFGFGERETGTEELPLEITVQEGHTADVDYVEFNPEGTHFLTVSLQEGQSSFGVPTDICAGFSGSGNRNVMHRAERMYTSAPTAAMCTACSIRKKAVIL